MLKCLLNEVTDRGRVKSKGVSVIFAVPHGSHDGHTSSLYR